MLYLLFYVNTYANVHNKDLLHIMIISVHMCIAGNLSIMAFVYSHMCWTDRFQHLIPYQSFVLYDFETL